MAETKQQLPRNVLWEIARLRQVKPIIDESIDYCLDKNGRAAISFEIETDILLDPSDHKFLDIEPIIFRYPTQESVGSWAPEVLSGRSDFPRDLLHLFPARTDEPASLCLARSGLQPIYNESGVGGVVSRLLDWLCDAKTETLYEDGWDPVPVMGGEPRIIGHIDSKALQQYAYDHPDGGFRFIGAGIKHLSDNKVFVHAGSPPINTSDVAELNSVKEHMQQSNEHPHPFHTVVPAVFIWPPRDRIEEKPIFTQWANIASFQEGLQETDLYNTLDEAFDYVDGYFDLHTEEGLPPEHDSRGHLALIVIVGLWRPAPLDPTIVGLSNEGGPRSLEIRPFYFRRESGDKDRWSKDSSLFDFFALVLNDSSTLESVSGVPAFGKVALLGMGALGSAFADYALRGGSNQLTVVDEDLFFPHNVARHRGDIRHVGLWKTDVAVDLASLRLLDGNVEIRRDDVISLDDDSLTEMFSKVKHVIDATANPLVRRRLSLFKGVHLPVMRSEIFHKGRLGVSILTILGEEQNLNCLFHQLVGLAMSNETVREWLAYESSRTYKDEELLLGFGCRSITTKLPAFMVDAHASNAFALASARLKSLNQPLIALHRLNEQGVSQGTELIAAEPVRLFVDAITNEWRVVVVEQVLEELRERRECAAPNETGGYLIGAIDEVASEIYVIAASPEPPRTEATPTSLKLGRWGLTDFEKALMRRTHNRLAPLGTWHSHPAGDATASKKDWATIRAFSAEDARRGIPTVMAITSFAGDAFYVQG